MITEEVLTTLKENAAVVTGVSAALIVLWRYFFKPLKTAVVSLRKHSEGITHILPLLSAGRERWPEQSGSGSFLHYIDTLDARVTHNECRTEVILDLSPHPVYECNPTGECIFANGLLCDLFGLSAEDMMGSGWLEGILPEERERVFETWQSSVNNKIPYECSYTIRNRKTGVRHNAVTRALPLEHDGVLIGYLGIFSSIEEIDISG